MTMITRLPISEEDRYLDIARHLLMECIEALRKAQRAGAATELVDDLIAQITEPLDTLTEFLAQLDEPVEEG